MGRLKEWVTEKEEEIRKETKIKMPHLSNEAIEAIVRSKILILTNSGRPELIQFESDPNDQDSSSDK